MADIVERHEPELRRISFADDLTLTRGSRVDWHYFKRWHYLGHTLGVMTDVYVLWDGETPVGFVLFGPTALRNKARHDVFGRVFSPGELNRWFSNAQRIILDPRYRGAGVAADMLRAACKAHAETRGVRYIELITSMGAVNYFGQAAGFKKLDERNQMTGGAGIGGQPRGYGWSGDEVHVRRVHQLMLDAGREFGIEFDGRQRSRLRRKRE